jgi:hypothetical protein
MEKLNTPENRIQGTFLYLITDSMDKQPIS